MFYWIESCWVGIFLVEIVKWMDDERRMDEEGRKRETTGQQWRYDLRCEEAAICRFVCRLGAAER